jgi:hypothetical protein
MNLRKSGTRHRGAIMKKLFVILFVIIALTCLFYPETTGTLIKIPVRVSTGMGFEKNLEKKDFALFINGEPREIVEFFSKSRSIDQIEAKRIFVLSFNNAEYGKDITETIFHFVLSILNGGDGLIIWSPAKKIYRFDTTGDRRKIARDIEKIVKVDSAAYKKERVTMRENLENLARMVALDPVSIKYFISSYARMFNDFKGKFLIPDLSAYNKLASYLVGEAENRWLINFYEQKKIPAFQNFQLAKEKIRRYTAGMKKSHADKAASINSGLDAIEKAMMISESYPMETILNFMLGLNISYNMIVGSNNESDDERVIPGYEGIFESLAKKTGGVFIAGTNPAEALNRVRKNIDSYYQVVFHFNGESEDKNIRVDVTKPDAKVFYRERFLKQEIDILVEMTSKTGLNITGYDLKGYNLKFKVSGFKAGEDGPAGKKTGAVRIDIRLIDDKNEEIHKTGRSLKPLENTIDVSLNLPVRFTGYFKLTIETADLISGRNARLDKYIKLK